MMGSKQRQFAPLIHVSLEELVPVDHFYRHLERTLDLSFVREFVQETYASKGRPSVDPVVFFKLQLVMFFEGLRSERQLMRHAADRLSVRWYLSYDLNEPLPDHSSLTRIRERYGVDIFRRFFDAIVEQCQNACPVKGQCTTSHQGRRLYRHVGEEYRERVRSYQHTRAYQKALRKRQVWVEPLFAEAKDWHGLRRFRLRLLWRVNIEALRIAAGQNLKRLLKKRGWGRRPFPVEALCASFLGLLRGCLTVWWSREGFWSRVWSPVAQLALD